MTVPAIHTHALTRIQPHSPGIVSSVINNVVGALLYGTLAAWRRSLRPGMIAHTVGDAVGVLVLARYFLK